MAIPTSLLLKGLGGLAVVSSVGATGLWWMVSSNDESTKSDEKKVIVDPLVPEASPTKEQTTTITTNSPATPASTMPQEQQQKQVEEGENDNKELNEKIEKLGIKDCKLGNKQTKKEGCKLNKAKMEAINFKGKNESNLISNSNVGDDFELTIEKGHEESDFPHGLRFIFKGISADDVTITLNNKAYALRENISMDFKIDKSDETKLEKAWTLKTLGEKVGLNCPEDDSNECTLKAEKINVWESESRYIVNAKSAGNKKIKVEKDKYNSHEGFEFSVGEDKDICLNENDSCGGNNNEKIKSLKKLNTNFEIGVKEINSDKKTWFLIQK